MHIRGGKNAFQSFPNDGTQRFRAATSSIEVHLRHVRCEGHRFIGFAHFRLHQVRIVEIGIESHGVKFRQGIPLLIDHHPVALGGTAVCY